MLSSDPCFAIPLRQNCVWKRCLPAETIGRTRTTQTKEGECNSMEQVQ